MHPSSAHELKIKRVVMRSFESGSRFASFIKGRAFWPVALKGGCENTLRDIILYDINTALGSNWICTGERNRIDIAIYRRELLEAPNCRQEDLRSPIAEIELKFNYARQAERELFRGGAAFNKIRARNVCEFAVIHIFCEIECADYVSSNLLKRYICCRPQEVGNGNKTKQNRTRAFHVIEKLLRENVMSAKITKLGPYSIGDGTRANRGMIQAYLLTPK